MGVTQIVPAEILDIQIVSDMEKVSFPDPWPLFLFKEILSHTDQYLFVAKKDQMIVGYIIFWFILDEVHILNICVSREHRKKGFGNELLCFCLNYFPKEKVSRFLLEVRKSNLPAISLYQKQGFKALYIREKYYPNGDDALVMELQK